MAAGTVSTGTSFFFLCPDFTNLAIVAPVIDTETGKELTYKLVSESEADLKAKKISVTSPMGAGLLGKKVGEIAVVETPRGNLEFEIVNISI